MLKFFRKYNKIILVIGGAFLMVSFLLMDSIGRLGGQLGLSQAYAKVGDSTVDRAAMQDSIRELQIVRRIAPEILMLIGIDGNNLTDHWFLLTYEAEKVGLLGGPGDGGAEFIETAASLIADSQAQRFAMFGDANFIQQQRAQSYQVFAERFASQRQIVIQTGQPERAVDMALAKMRSIIRLLETQPGADTLSRPEAVAYAAEIFDTAVVSLGVIPPNATDPTIAPATDDEIAAHFEEFKDQRPADNELGIGYRLEPAVKIEYIAIEREGLIDALNPTVDEIEVNKYWRSNKARFGEDWSAAKASATSAYVAERADEILEKAVRVAQREMRRVTRNLERDGKYAVLPDDWDDQRLQMVVLAGTIRQEMSDEFGFEMPMPAYQAPTQNFLDGVALTGLRGLGTSAWSLNDTVRVPFSDLMLNTRELGGNEDYGLQRGVTFGPLRSPTGVYFVRIDDTRTEGAADTMNAALRERIAENIRAIKQYEDLLAASEEFRSRLVTEGFNEGIASIAPGTPLQNMEVTRRQVATPGSTIPAVRFDFEDIRTAIMDRVQQWDPLADVAVEIPIEDRVFVLPLPSEKAMLAAMVTSREPLTYEEFHDSSSSIRAVALEKRDEAMAQVPFSIEALQRRLNVTFLDQVGEERDLSDTDEEPLPEDENGVDEAE